MYHLINMTSKNLGDGSRMKVHLQPPTSPSRNSNGREKIEGLHEISDGRGLESLSPYPTRYVAKKPLCLCPRSSKKECAKLLTCVKTAIVKKLT